jgi:ActR/RegA family two-component response regulator
MSQAEIKTSVGTCRGNLGGIPPVHVAEKVFASRSVLLGVLDQMLAQRLAAEVARFAFRTAVTTASSLAELRDLAANSDPEVILFDSNLLGNEGLAELVRQLANIAPVLVLASVSSQAEMSRLVALGNVEFVGRAGDYVPLVAALIERRLNGYPLPLPQIPDVDKPVLSARLGELFRHEINNPLTGILGNAELVLAHREHLSAVEVHRLQTVVDLAVRLRESIRRISSACEKDVAAANSA